MPVYDYSCEECGITVERTHTIKKCSKPVYCDKCDQQMRRLISSPHVEGTGIYPVRLWNLPIPGDVRGVVVNNKSEHWAILQKYKCQSPAVTKYGKGVHYG